MTQEIAQANIKRYNLVSPEQTYGYQPADWEIVDYKQKRFLQTPVFFRSSPFDDLPKQPGRPRVAMVGAAQILGRFCAEALPDIITSTTNWIGQNYGYSGAAPSMFLHLGGAFFKRLNECDAVVIQLMSGRAAPNGQFSTPNPHFPNKVQVKGVAEPMFVNNAWNHLLNNMTAKEFYIAITQSRANYVRHMTKLIESITTKKILLWYSDRVPDYEMNFMSWKNVLGEFPHLVTGAMVKELIPLCDAYVETVSSAGRPHRLVNRFTNEIINFYKDRPDPTENYYYPSQEMHYVAAAALTPVLKSLQP